MVKVIDNDLLYSAIGEREVSLKLLSFYQVDCTERFCFLLFSWLKKDEREYCPRKGVRSQGAAKSNSSLLTLK